MSARIAAAVFVPGLSGRNITGRVATISGRIRQAQPSDIVPWICAFTDNLPKQSNQSHRNCDERDLDHIMAKISILYLNNKVRGSTCAVTLARMYHRLLS